MTTLVKQARDLFQALSKLPDSPERSRLIEQARTLRDDLTRHRDALGNVQAALERSEQPFYEAMRDLGEENLKA